MALDSGAGVLGAVSLPLLWMNMHAYQQQRVLTFLDPESDPLGAGWNIIQSKTAIGSGGIFGKGWQAGSQAQLDFCRKVIRISLSRCWQKSWVCWVSSSCWRCIYL